MTNQANLSGLLNRNKTTTDVFQKVFSEVEKETTNSALASQFPEWDLTPPANLVKRRSTKLL